MQLLTHPIPRSRITPVTLPQPSSQPYLSLHDSHRLDWVGHESTQGKAGIMTLRKNLLLGRTNLTKASAKQVGNLCQGNSITTIVNLHQLSRILCLFLCHFPQVFTVFAGYGGGGDESMDS